MERLIHGYRFDDEKPVAVGVSSVTYRAVREGAADVEIPVSIKVIDLRAPLEDTGQTGQRPNVDLLDSPPLQHANIVDVRDVIRMGGGRVGIVRELVDGPSVGVLLDHVGDRPLYPPAALYIARQCASALAFAHGKNLVHGDFCHRHVLLSRDGQVKVSDFQVSSLLARANRSETRLRAGKRFFLAPEALLRPAQLPGPESDVFALGVLLFRMICGYYPYPDPEAMLQGLAPEMRIADEEWGTPTRKLLFECLSIEPELRPPSGEVERRLRRILGPSWPGYGSSELADFLEQVRHVPPRAPTQHAVNGAARSPAAPAAPAPPAVIMHAPPQPAAGSGELPAGPLRPPPEARSGTDPIPSSAAGFVPESTVVARRPEPGEQWQVAAPPPLPQEPAVQPPPPLRRRMPRSEEPPFSPGSVEERLSRLEQLATQLLEGRPLPAEQDPLVQELIERVARLEEANTYLSHELETLRVRFDTLIAGLANIITTDTQQ